MPDPTPETKKEMTVEQAAKSVKRTVIETVDGKDGEKKQIVKKVSVSAAEVLSFKDYGTHVVVVTKDGQKLSSGDE